MKSLITVLLLLLLAGCASQKTDQLDLLQGTWVEKDKKPLISPFGQIAGADPNIKDQYAVYRYDGFAIINNNYDNLEGFYQRRKRYNDPSGDLYFSPLTDLKISGDSILYYNPIKKEFAFKGTVESLTNQSLLLLDGNNVLTEYIKQKNKMHQTFDRIAINLSPCFGTCPVFELSIDKNGSVLFDGKQHTVKAGKYRTQLSPTLIDYLFSKFEQQPILKYKDRYAATFTDAQTTTIKFYKNGRLVKTISDYAGYSPQELLWAMEPLKKLYLRKDIDWSKINE